MRETLEAWKVGVVAVREAWMARLTVPTRARCSSSARHEEEEEGEEGQVEETWGEFKRNVEKTVGEGGEREWEKGNLQGWKGREKDKTQELARL